MLALGATACGGGGASSAGGAAVPQAPPRQGPGAAVFSPAPRPVVELRRGRRLRELVRIGTRHVALGPEGGPLAWKLFAEPRRADDAWSFAQTYAPFTLESPEADLSFLGRGTVKAGPAERRMILEWARQVAVEAAAGRGAAAYGLVLAWHQGGTAGLCEDVVLSLTGEAVATACGWEGEASGRLDPAALDDVYGWFDRFQPFQMGAGEREESLRPGSLQVRLIFAGRGGRFAMPKEQRQIQSFAAAVFSELAARRRSAAAPATPAASPAPRLLIPPGAGLAPQELRLEFPDRPPPVPRLSPSLPLYSPLGPQSSSSRRSRPQPVR